MPRLFIAFPLTEAVRGELLRQQAVLRSRREAVTWVAGPAMHLTAVFLGELPEGRIPELCDLLEIVAEHQAPLRFHLGPPGVFGGERPKVLFTSLTGPVETLRTLVERLEQRLRRLGVPLEKRRYRPHVTLGRVRSGGEELAAAHLGNAPLPLSVDLTRLVLFESRLHPEGPLYTALADFPLAGAGDGDNLQPSREDRP
jgi:2'-5' RNA ligase